MFLKITPTGLGAGTGTYPAPAPVDVKGEEFLRRLQGALEKGPGGEKTPAPGDEAVRAKEREELLAACRQFEAIMVQQMFKAMRAAIPSSHYLGESMAREVYQDMLDEQYCLEAGKSGQLGLAEMLAQQLQPANPKAVQDK